MGLGGTVVSCDDCPPLQAAASSPRASGPLEGSVTLSRSALRMPMSCQAQMLTLLLTF